MFACSTYKFLFVTLAVHVLFETKFKFTESRKSPRQGTVLNGPKTGVVVVDMWDKHWCPSAMKSLDPLSKKINIFLDYLRSKGGQVCSAWCTWVKLDKNLWYMIFISKSFGGVSLCIDC